MAASSRCSVVRRYLPQSCSHYRKQQPSPLRRDQRLYVQQLPAGGGAPSEPRPLTAADSKLRFADGDVDAARNRLATVLCGAVLN